MYLNGISHSAFLNLKKRYFRTTLTTRVMFPRAAEALFQTKKTYVKQLHLRQHEDSRHAMKTDRITSAEQIDCAVQVVFESANKSKNRFLFLGAKNQLESMSTMDSHSKKDQGTSLPLVL